MAFDTDSLTTKVGDLLRLSITASTKPSTTQVDNWLAEGGIELFKHLKPDVLHDAVTIAELTLPVVISDDGSNNVSLPADFLKSVRVSFRTPSTIYSDVMVVDSKQGGIYGKITSVDVVWFSDNKIYVNNVTSSSTIRLRYLPVPATSTIVPSEFHQYLIDYAVAKAKEQDSEGKGLLQSWYEMVKTL